MDSIRKRHEYTLFPPFAEDFEQTYQDMYDALKLNVKTRVVSSRWQSVLFLLLLLLLFLLLVVGGGGGGGGGGEFAVYCWFVNKPRLWPKKGSQSIKHRGKLARKTKPEEHQANDLCVHRATDRAEPDTAQPSMQPQNLEGGASAQGTPIARIFSSNWSLVSIYRSVPCPNNKRTGELYQHFRNRQTGVVHLFVLYVIVYVWVFRQLCFSLWSAIYVTCLVKCPFWALQPQGYGSFPTVFI